VVGTQKTKRTATNNLLEQASKKEPSYADFLDELLNCQIEARRTRYLRAKAALGSTASEAKEAHS
jgi:hypothetical protein